MEDNALQPNPPQPLPGDEGLSAESPVPQENPSAMGSFLRHFGVGKDGNKNGVPPQPDSQPVPETPDAPADFASRLNGTGTPSMEGADVVSGPNSPVASEATISQPPQAPQMQASNLGASGIEGSASTIGEPMIGGPTPTSETQSSMGTPNMDTIPDLAGLAINTPAQDVSESPNPVSSQEAVDDNKAILAETRESLASIADQADQMKNAIEQQLKELDERLGANLSNAPVDTTAGSTPKEPVGVGS